MRPFKQYLSNLPEYLLLLAISIYLLVDLLMTGKFSYLLLIPLAGAIALLIWKNKILAYVYSLILGLGCFYMLLALLSEHSEFPAGDPAGSAMLFTGSLIFVSLIAISITMGIKYFRMNT